MQKMNSREERQLALVRSAKAALIKALFDEPDVNGVGIGKSEDGKSYILCVNLVSPRLDLEHKYPSIDGIPIEFRVIGIIRPLEA